MIKQVVKSKKKYKHHTSAVLNIILWTCEACFTSMYYALMKSSENFWDVDCCLGLNNRFVTKQQPIINERFSLKI